MSKNKKFIFLTISVVVLSLLIYNVVLNSSIYHEKVKDARNIDPVKFKIKDSINNEDLLEILEKEKNNSIHCFLKKKSKSDIYFLDLLIDTVSIVRIDDKIKYSSSIEISTLDKEYVSMFIERVTPFLLEKNIDSLTILLMLPVDKNSIPSPPPPAIDFYGNIKGGKIPELIKITY